MLPGRRTDRGAAYGSESGGYSRSRSTWSSIPPRKSLRTALTESMGRPRLSARMLRGHPIPAPLRSRLRAGPVGAVPQRGLPRYGFADPAEFRITCRGCGCRHGESEGVWDCGERRPAPEGATTGELRILACIGTGTESQDRSNNPVLPRTSDPDQSLSSSGPHSTA